MSDPTGSDKEMSFAELFGQGDALPEQLEPGQKVTGSIIRIGKDWVFISLGGKSEGCLPVAEVTDPEGRISVREGQAIEAYFLSSSRGGMLFTTKLGRGSEAHAHLEAAFQSGIPVDGVIEKEIKGGFQVRLAGGARGFCPFSQLGIAREEGADLTGTSLPFRITQFSEGGRNLVVSHRQFREEERQRQMDTLRETLHEGMTVSGAVTSVQKFGAFVDIGGLEGLLPVSEISWSRVEEVSERLAVGQKLDVMVKSLDWEKKRFSFSLKSVLPDPWLSAAERFPVGSVQVGRVSRLANFGAFVTLADGIDGLLHISTLSRGKRLTHPREAVAEGQELEVRIEAVKSEERRISLAPVADLTPASKVVPVKTVDPAEEEARLAYEEYLASTKKPSAGARSMGTLGDLLAARLKK